MNSNLMGIMIGGVLPAIIFGVGGVFVKASSQQGISLNYFTLLSGTGAIVISLLSFLIFKEKSINIQSGLSASLVGVTWVAGILFVSMALTKYNTPLSIISPLNCTACLVTVLLAMFIFSEWKETQSMRLLIGTVLIIIGAMLVSTSTKEENIQQLNLPENQNHIENFHNTDKS